MCEFDHARGAPGVRVGRCGAPAASRVPASRTHGTGHRWHDNDLVFASEVGTAIFPSNFTRSFHRLLKRAGMERMRVHNRRHSCATFLTLQSVEPRTAMEILGHSNITITPQIYTHALEHAKCIAITKMDTLLDTKEAG